MLLDLLDADAAGGVLGEELLEQVQVRLTCIYGGVDSLTPQHDRYAIESALKKQRYAPDVPIS